MIAELRGLAEPQDLVVDQTRRTNATLRGADLVIPVGCVKRSGTHQFPTLSQSGALRSASRTPRLNQQTRAEYHTASKGTAEPERSVLQAVAARKIGQAMILTGCSGFATICRVFVSDDSTIMR